MNILPAGLALTTFGFTLVMAIPIVGPHLAGLF
jgi:hypothetical protein